MVGGKLVAVFFSEGKYFAIDDTCPHMGASLHGAGEVGNGEVDLSLARLAVRHLRRHLVRQPQAQGEPL